MTDRPPPGRADDELDGMDAERMRTARQMLAQLPALTFEELDVLGGLVDKEIEEKPSAFPLLNALRTAIREAQSSIDPAHRTLP